MRNNNSLIPSRSERKSHGVKWNRAFKNLYRLPGVTAQEKEFCFKLQQDLLLINGRNHRNNDKSCRRNLDGNTLCNVVQDRSHYFIYCPRIKDSFSELKSLLANFVGKFFNHLQITF